MLLFYFTIMSLGLIMIAVVLFRERQGKLDFNHGENAPKEEVKLSSDFVEHTLEKGGQPEEQSPSEQYKRLEILFEEKSKELEKIQRALVNELELRKEFNALREVLENEILELKNKNQTLLLERNTSKAGNQNRIHQLEDRLSEVSENLTIVDV